MTTGPGWSVDEVAARVAADLPPGACVNLGIGLPTTVASHLDPSRDILLHSENGIVGMRGLEVGEVPDWDIIDAGKQPVGLVAGAAILDHEDSFTLIRGGRLDVAVLGAYEVSRTGDLASWALAEEPLGSVGGAMDIAIGARQVMVMMRHTDRQGHPKLVQRCRHPVTARTCVHRIYTDLAIVDVTAAGFIARELAAGVTLEHLQRATDGPIRLEGGLGVG